MLVRVGAQGPEREVRWRTLDVPVATIVAGTPRAGFARRGTGFIEILVEPWEDAVKVKAQAGGNLNRIDDVTDREMSTLMAFQPTDVYVEPDAVRPSRRARRDDKPPYEVPTMAQIRRKRRRGRRRKVVSTFSCAGGSTLGYRMAGFDVAAAVEVDELPAASYRLNNPKATVLEKDIREVTAEEILEATGLERGELDLLDGSPPCTSFSTAGLRSRTWGKTRKHAGVDQRIDDLFFEYARLLDDLQPKAFVAENVKGLATGASIGYFKAILRVLRKCGYVVAAQVLDADQLGVPQHRERIFFVGVRNDVAKLLDLDVDAIHDDVFPKPLPHSYTVRDALPWLDPSSDAYSLQGTPFGEPERVAAGKATPPERVKPAGKAPAATIAATGQRQGVQVVHDKRRPDQGERDVLDAPAPTVTASEGRSGRENTKVQVVHDTQGNAYPEPRDVIDQPAPAITPGSNGWNSDHFKVEVVHDTGRAGRDGRDVLDEAAPTIVNGTDDPAAGGGARNHWKVVETAEGGTVYRRKFTILEVKRLCSFPDDFQLEGKFAQQWAQLGNSVPPLMMRAVAEGLDRRVFRPLERHGL